MGIELVGTRTAGIAETASIVERVDPSSGAGIAIASAYWDATACDAAIDLARRVGGVARLVLWTAGATRGAWLAALDAMGSHELDLRFIESPADGGIFHAKVAGVTQRNGDWTCALVGSANLTAAGRGKNVELGVLIRDEPASLGQLCTWFEELWEQAVPAGDFDWDTAINIAPERSEAAARKRLFAEQALAPHAPAAPIAPARAPFSRAPAATPGSLLHCGEDAGMIERYLDTLAEQLTSTNEGQAKGELGWRAVAGSRVTKLQVGFDQPSSTVRLRMYPADTLGQARAFYRDQTQVDALLGLRDGGWLIRPNFHWGFVERGYAHADPDEIPIDADAYCAFWVAAVERGLHQIKRPDWEGYWSNLEAHAMVAPSQRAAFDGAFSETKRTTADPRPGLRCEFAWPLDTARRLDAEGALEPALRTQANKLLAALQEPDLPQP